MLTVDGVGVTFGGVKALQNASFEVPTGTVTGLIGPNGAGKTTLFNVVTGLLKPTRGKVFLDGRDITRKSPAARAKLGLGRTFQRLEVFGTLSVRENVLVAAETHRGWFRASRDAAKSAEALIERVGLKTVADVPSDILPTGMARLLEVARALAIEPKVLLLDEPGSGLDERESAALGDLLLSLAEDGMAVLLVEHDVDLVMRVCSTLNVLDFGILIASGSAAEVQADPRVQEAYLGVPTGAGLEEAAL